MLDLEYLNVFSLHEQPSFSYKKTTKSGAFNFTIHSSQSKVNIWLWPETAR